MPKNTGPLFELTTGKYKQVTWQLPTDTDSSRTLVLFISFYLNTNRWPANDMAQVPLVTPANSLKIMMLKQDLAQRGQAGGSNVRIPEQSSNPKHSLHKCTWSE